MIIDPEPLSGGLGVRRENLSFQVARDTLCRIPVRHLLESESLEESPKPLVESDELAKDRTHFIALCGHHRHQQSHRVGPGISNDISLQIDYDSQWNRRPVSGRGRIAASF